MITGSLLNLCSVLVAAHSISNALLTLAAVGLCSLSSHTSFGPSQKLCHKEIQREIHRPA